MSASGSESHDACLADVMVSTAVFPSLSARESALKIFGLGIPS